MTLYLQSQSPHLSSYYDDPVLWQLMTKDQRKMIKDQLRAEQPHLLPYNQSPHRNPTTSHSPCLQTTLPQKDMLKDGLQTTPDTKLLDQPPKDHESPVDDRYLQIAQTTLQGIAASLAEEHGQPTNLLALKASCAASNPQAVASFTRYLLQKYVEAAARDLLSPPYLPINCHRSPTGIWSLPKPARSMTPPYQEDIR